jgi:hypothetical protein
MLNARGVDVLRLCHRMRVTLSSLQPCLYNGLKKAWHCSDTAGAAEPGIQEERESFWTSRPRESVRDCGLAALRVRMSAVASWGAG